MSEEKIICSCENLSPSGLNHFEKMSPIPPPALKHTKLIQERAEFIILNSSSLEAIQPDSTFFAATSPPALALLDVTKIPTFDRQTELTSHAKQVTE